MPRTSSSDDRSRRGRGGRASSRVGEWLVVIFCFGALAFSPLVIGIFDRGAATMVLGIPLLYFYLFCAWALLILAIFVVMGSPAERRRTAAEPEPQRPRGEGRSP